MQLNRVEAQNFLSFGPAQSLDLSQCGLMLVEGVNHDDDLARSNGAGKSAISEALFWALFGKTLRGLKGDAVIHERAKGDCYVILEGEHHGQPFRVVRSRKGSAHACPLTFHVSEDDRTAGNDSAETQRRIEAFVGYSADVFAHCVIFGQGAAWRFTQLSDAERKTLLDKLLGLERIGRAHAHIKTRLSEANAEVAECQHAYQTARIERDAAKRLWRGLRRERKTYVTAQREVLTERCARLDAKLAQSPPTTEPDVGLPNRIRRQEVVAAKFAQAYDEAVEDRARASAEKAQVERRLQEASRTLKRLEKASPGQPCDACGVVMDDAQLAQRCEMAVQAHRQIKQELAKVEREEASMSAHLSHAARQVAEARQALRALEQALIKQDRQADALAARAQLEADRAEVVSQIKALATPTPSDSEKQAKQAYLTGKQTVKQAKSALRQAESEAAHLNFWAHGFGPAGVKSHLLDHVTPMLNHHAAQYAQQLTSTLQVEFSSQSTLKSGEMRDKLSLMVRNSHGATGYEGASQGERRKVDIVVALALGAILQGERRCNVAVFDEIFESLDETSAEAVMSLLRQEAEQRSSVLVISHAEWLKSHFPHVLTVVKESGFSRIEHGSL